MADFNATFVVHLLEEMMFEFSAIMFSLYFMVSDPRNVAEFSWLAMFITPMILYPFSIGALCMTASELSQNCDRLVAKLQQVPVKMLTAEEQWQVKSRFFLLHRLKL